jgi:hypothetical protein
VASIEGIPGDVKEKIEQNPKGSEGLPGKCLLLKSPGVNSREFSREFSLPILCEANFDGFVKNPTSALRCILRHCSVL